MTPEQVVFQNWPIIAIVALVASAVAGSSWKVWDVLSKFIERRDEQWQAYLDKSEQRCKEWTDAQAKDTREWQLQMTNAMRDIAASVERFDDRLNTMATAFDTAMTLLQSKKIQTGPLNPSKDKRL